MIMLICGVVMIPRTVYAEDVNIDDSLIVDNNGSEGETSLPNKDELSEVDTLAIGKIKLKLTKGATGTSKVGVKFACSKVADIEGGEYVLHDEYTTQGVDLNEIKNAKELKDAAVKLAECTDDDENVALTDDNGKLTYTDLEVGVYLIKAVNTDNYDDVEPFLMAIPTFDHSKKVMTYEVSVYPKHTPKPEPKKEIKEAPQTDLYSPILLYFGAAGLLIVMLIIFNVVTRKRKKNKR